MSVSVLICLCYCVYLCMYMYLCVHVCPCVYTWVCACQFSSVLALAAVHSVKNLKTTTNYVILIKAVRTDFRG